MNQNNWVKADKFATVFVGIIIVLATFLTSLLLPERGGPDEGHHIAHISHVAGSDASLFLDYENVSTDLQHLNHLIHPPAYYVITGTVLRAIIPVSSTLRYLQIDPSLQEYLLTHDEVYFNLKSQVSKVSRLVSVTMMVWAIWLACRLILLFKEFGHQRYSLGALFLLISLANPAAILVTSVANNDALVLPVTFLLALPLTRLALVHKERRMSSYLQLFGISIPLAILTKATIWPLAAGSAALALLLLWRNDRNKLRHVFHGTGLRTLKEPRVFLQLMLSLFLWVWSSLYLLRMKLTYGSFQPDYGDVYGQTTPGKFEGVTPVNPNFEDFIGRVTNAGYRSLAGFMGQRERFLEPINSRVFISLLTIFFISLLLCIGLRRSPARILGLSVFALPLFLLFWAIRSWPGYQAGGYYASQGRYFLPYLIFSAMGVGVLVSARMKSFQKGKHVAFVSVLQILGVVIFATLCLQVSSPFKYLSSTSTFSDAAGNEESVLEKFEQDGVPLTLEPGGNEKFVNLVNETGRYELAWSGSVVHLVAKNAQDWSESSVNKMSTLFLLIRPSASGTPVTLEIEQESCSTAEEIVVIQRGWYAIEIPTTCISIPRLTLGRGLDFPNPGSVTLEAAYVLHQ